MHTFSEENYLKAIYHLSASSDKGVSTSAIAKKLQTKASSVTDMIQRLAEKEVLEYKKYQGVTLTAAGHRAAALIIRKHRLWEVFLVEKLNFNWDEVHDVAEQLEHIRSPKLIDEIDAMLGYPTVDPHGDPIPDKNGKITFQKKVPLSAIAVNVSSDLVAVNDTSDLFLKYLNKKNIAIGQTINVLHREPFDQSMIIQVNGEELLISKDVAENLFVKDPS